MTILLTAGSSSIVATLPSGVPNIGMATGLGVTAIGKIVGTGVLSTAGGAIAGSSASATILGSAWSGTAAGAVVGGLAGAAASTAAVLTQGMLAGPIGYLILGSDPQHCTFDCWKPVLRDMSEAPSHGKLLKDVCADERINTVIMTPHENSLPNIILENVWGEQFQIEYVSANDNIISLHAVKMNQN